MSDRTLWCAVDGQMHGYQGIADHSCEVVRLVESRDSDGRLLALLVVDECERCEGLGCAMCLSDRQRHETDYRGQYVGSGTGHASHQCSSCGGRGWQPRADYDTTESIVVPLPDD